MDWNNIINVNELEYEDWSLTNAYAGKTAECDEKLKTNKLGFHVEMLSPGKFSCPYHYHLSEEELFFVLGGKAMLRQNDRFRELTKGDLIYFPAHETGVHQFYNHTNEDFRFIAISTREKNDICIYPDSGKINIRRSRKLFKLESDVPYTVDEEHPEKFWDDEALMRE